MNEKLIQIEKSYRERGLEVEVGHDEADKIYEPHSHEQTFLYTTDGSLKIRIDDGEWQDLKPGQEFTVGSNQLHEAVVGPYGWGYIAGWDEEEAKQFEHS